MSAVGRRGFLAGAALSVPLLAASGTASAQPAAANRNHDLTAGADILAAQRWRPLAGRKVGVVSNPTGVLRDGTHIVDSMVAAGITPTAAFGPEHGFRGTSQAGGSEGDYTDPRTGIPVYDAYGATAEKLTAMYVKAGIDTVLFDIADVGSRFYTYIWTLYTAMQAAAATGATVVVLDRANPIGGAGLRADARPGVRVRHRPEADRAAARHDRRRAGQVLRRRTAAVPTAAR